MERLDRIPLNTSFSLHSVAEGSEIISEAEEIQEVYNLQHTGSRALETSDYDNALRCFEEALEIDENNIESLHGRAEVYLQLGKYVLSQLDAERILAIYPKDPHALSLQGQALGKLSYYREAIVVFLKALDIESNSDEACDVLTAHIADMASKYCPMPDKLIHKLPAMEPYKKLCEVGSSLFHAKRYDLSIRVLNAAQKLETNQKGITMKIQLTLANSHAALKHPELAISLYQECLATAQGVHDVPYQTKSLVSIASLFLEQGDTHQAIMYYEHLLDLQNELQGETIHGPLPEYWSKDLQCALHLNMSIAYKSIGNLKLAMKHAKIYLELIEGRDLLRDNAEALSQQNIGVLHEILGKYMTALEHFKTFLALSRKKGDKKGVAQAYGCLGSVYAKLGNVSMSKTYHEQFLNTARSLDDEKLVTLSHEQYGDTHVYLGTLEEAVEQYMLMFKSCSRSDPQSQTKALCKLGKAYRSQKRFQYSIYYFEQAKVIADDFNLTSIRAICEYNISCILQNSTQMKELDLARRYLEKLVPMLENKVVQHLEEDTFCSEELLEELQECYSAIQNVLCKLGENNLCLSYAEAAKWRYLGDFVKPGFGSVGSSGFSLWNMEQICRVVNQQNATVLYYTMLKDSYMLWVLQPGKGLIRFYQWKCQNKNFDLVKSIRSEINDIKTSGLEIEVNELQYENRSIPYQDEILNIIRRKNKKLESKSDETEDENSVDSRPKTSLSSQSQASPSQSLFKLLISPVYDVLSDLEEASPVVVIPDGCLCDCPFGSLRDWGGRYLGDRFIITYVTNLYLLGQATHNQLNWLKVMDEQDFERTQSRLGGIQRILHSNNLRPDTEPHGRRHDADTVSSVDLASIDLKRTSNPRLITSGAFSSRPKPGNRSRENTFLSTRLSPGSSAAGSKRNGAASSVLSPPKTAGLPGPAPTSLERVVGLETLSTLTKRTATNTDIVTSSCRVMDYRQVCDTHRCVVIGNPALPRKVQLHDSEWRPCLDLSSAHAECTRVADIFDVPAIAGEEATKDRFILEIQQAAVIHIATRMCHREGYIIFSPNKDRSEDGAPEVASYIMMTDEIRSLRIAAKLVVLSGGWAVTDKPVSLDGYKIASALIEAGAQCVLSLLWAVPSLVLTKFYHQFYLSLQSGNKISSAAREAVQVLKQDQRYNGIACWSPWQLVGKDTEVDLLQIRQSMLHQDLNRIEQQVTEKCSKAKLNPDPVTPNVANKEENLSSLQECMAALLIPCKASTQVITALIDLMGEALRCVQMNDNSRRPVQIPDCITDHQGAMRLLKLLDFHFQSKGAEIREPYVVFPHWDKDGLLLPTYDAIRALNDIIENSVCSAAIKQILPLSQNMVSHMVDMLTITKNAPDIQLKITDLSVKPLWTQSKIKKTLHTVGFQQIGVLLKFNNVPSNRRLLAASLQLMIAVSIHKDPVLLHKLDIHMLGTPQNTKSVATTAEMSRLPSLMPVLLSRQQIKMSAPWLSVAEKTEEMDEKIKLTRSKTDLTRDLTCHQTQARTWHKDSIAAQANVSLDEVGKKIVTPLKVKVIRGSTMSSSNVPVDQKMALTSPQTDQRRDYAAYILQQRLDDMTLRHRNEERRLYLPYIINA